MLSKLAIDNGFKHISVQNYQNFLVSSLDFRLIAVRKIRSSKGSQTAGVDNVILQTDTEWLDLVEKLLDLKDYKSKPVKRVNIPKGGGKARSLGIPTIFDRGVQSLFKLITEPIIEVQADLNSGFRKNRSAHEALARLRSILNSKVGTENIVILNLDIKGFFDNICHKWIYDNYPISNKYKYILNSWLISGIIVIDKVFKTTNAGVPQGGIISLTISNFVLNGLEECINDSIKPIITSKTWVKEYYGIKSGIPVVKRFNMQFIRYADDFVITCGSMYIAKTYIKPAIIDFLKERGVWLSEEKSFIFRLSDKSLDFLGYTFIYSSAWKPGGIFRGKTGLPGIALIPQKKKFEVICKTIRDKFHYNLNKDAYKLIAMVNPIIKGWCEYFKYGQTVTYRKKLEHYLYKLCWRWARRKHPRWGLKLIASIYFFRRNKAKFKGRVWAFRGQILKKSRYKSIITKGKSIFLVNPIADIDITRMFNAKLLKKLMPIHRYHKDLIKVNTFLADQKIENRKKHMSMKDQLYSKQKGVCSGLKTWIDGV
jgi:RNA-directed DNA polymerase